MEDRWGDYTFYRMNKVIDVYFVGGFGSLNWVWALTQSTTCSFGHVNQMFACTTS